MPDQKIDRIIRRLALVLIVGTVAFFGYYVLDRHPLADTSLVDRQIAKEEDAVRADPANVDGRMALAGLYLGGKRFTDAAQQYDEVLSLQPDNVTALLGRGSALYLAKDLPGAEAMYQKVVDLTVDGEFTKVDPAVEEAHYYLGSIAQHTGRTDRAISEYKAAIAIEPTDADALYGLGTSLTAGGQAEEALAPLKKAVAFVPLEWTEPYVALKAAYTKLDRPKDAAWADAMVDLTHQQYQQGADKLRTLVGPNASVDALLGLAFATEALGDLDQAGDWYKAVLAVDPDSFSAAQGLARVAPDQVPSFAPTTPEPSAAPATTQPMPAQPDKTPASRAPKAPGAAR